ncbi:MAG: glycosyltransferase family 4 protein [Methylococcales bacterium]
MNICLLSLHYSDYSLRLASALSKRNNVLLIVSLDNFTNELPVKPEDITLPNLTVVAIRHRNIKNPLVFLNALSIVSAIRRFNPDIIHCQETLKDYQVMALPFLSKYPFVLTIHDHVPHSGSDTQILKNSRHGRYRKILRKHADAFIVHGEKIAEEMRLMWPGLKNSIYTANHGVLGELPEKMNYDWEDSLLLFFGRIEEYKGLRYFLDALDILDKRGIKVHGLIAGKGTASMDRERQRIAVMDNCEFRDEYIDNAVIPELFSSAHIVVLPYVDATQSGVASFALQYGRPIIATNVGGLPEMVRNNYNGLIIPPCDSISIADAIVKILSDRELSTSMADNSRQLAVSDYSWDNIARRTVSIYETVLNDI